MAESIASIENDWLEFSQLAEMKNHWRREGWWPGRTGYYWYLTFEDSPALHELARKCQAALQGNPTYDLTPIEGLHLTLDRIGFEDEITDDELDQVEEQADTLVRDHPALVINVGPLAGSASALNFSVTPREPLDHLRTSLSTASRIVTNSVASEGHFRPHIGIAYLNSPGSAKPVIDTVSQLRNFSPVAVTVDHVSLVRLTRRERAYEWTARRSFPLTGISAG